MNIKILSTLVTLLFLQTARAQTDSLTFVSYADKFPKLPPLKVVFDGSLSPQPQLLDLHTFAVQNDKSQTDNAHSMMFLKREVKNKNPHLKFDLGKYKYDYSDHLGKVRDEIVRRRMLRRMNQ